ncbi:unnamed protein product [Brassica oleracea]|uniref:Uncharacterized protein n=1 Tax=Brassica oleracea TaxID=3712 RepID=A0A3P6G840_BRAOL|nr:unnamed protein product [Brassica oleracea]
MAKWSAIVLIMMVVIAVAPHHGNCFKHCKAKCGDTNPHHGPGGHHQGPGGPLPPPRY